MVSRMFWCSAVRAGRKGSECLSQSESSTPERLCTALSRMSKMKVENEKAKQCYAQRVSKVSEMRSVVRWNRAERVSGMSKMKVENEKAKQCYAQRVSKVSEMRTVVRWNRAERVSGMFVKADVAMFLIRRFGLIILYMH